MVVFTMHRLQRPIHCLQHPLTSIQLERGNNLSLVTIIVHDETDLVDEMVAIKIDFALAKYF